VKSLWKKLINSAPCALYAEFYLDEPLTLGANQMYQILAHDRNVPEGP